MGNQLANESGSKGPTRTFGRTGALGLTKAELDRRCTPSGLYPFCHWDDKAVRRLIGDGRLAERCKGNDSRKSMADQECPICFLHYHQLNVTQCCRANICTECFLQVRPQKEKHSVCPFCNNPKMFVSIAKRLDAGEIQERETKEQRMIEATIRARGQSEAMPITEGFGSSLEKNEIVRRARSRTLSEDHGGNIPDDVQLLRQLSLSAEDRLALEREMRAQHTHPLALQVDAEAEERRIANEREYYRNNPDRSREANMQRGRLGNSGSLRNRLTRMNSTGSRRRYNDDSLDDMIVLEAALLLSMEEDGRGGGSGEPQNSTRVPNNEMMSQNRRPRGPMRTASMSAIPSSSSRFGGSLSEDEQVAMAIALSMQEQQESASNAGSDEKEPTDCETPPESAPPKSACVSVSASASAPSSTGVASLPIVSEDDDDDDDDTFANEDMILQARQEFQGKSSDDDSAFFRMVSETDDDFDARISTCEVVPRLKEG